MPPGKIRMLVFSQFLARGNKIVLTIYFDEKHSLQKEFLLSLKTTSELCAS
jgi:hypothetical protein